MSAWNAKQPLYHMGIWIKEAGGRGMEIQLKERMLPVPLHGGFHMEGFWVWCGSVSFGWFLQTAVGEAFPENGTYPDGAAAERRIIQMCCWIWQISIWRKITPRILPWPTLRPRQASAQITSAVYYSVPQRDRWDDNTPGTAKYVTEKPKRGCEKRS